MIYQIYHTARVGSTLLTSLLSSLGNAYSEPSWTKDLLNVSELPDTISNHYGSIVKFQSINTRVGFKPPGPKVFLYRPLSQYLYKMNTCTDEWIDGRKKMYSEWYEQIKGEELKGFFPENIMQLHAIFWAASLIEMQKSQDVLWIQSNDFFLNKELIANQVFNHFNIDANPEMRFANIDVKTLKLNMKDEPISFNNYTNFNLINTSTHGIIKSVDALKNEQISKTIEWANLVIPIDYKHLL